jgi:riboflavin kinase/FMN adenylyltransferase
MEVITDPAGCPPAGQGTVVTIGAYDGVHVGHRSIISEVCRLAEDRGLASAVVTFDKHPATIVRPESAPLLLTDLAQKLELLGSTGVDYTVVIEFDEKRARESAEDFVTEVVVECLRARLVIVGEDFHFGHRRRGNVALLREMGAQAGFDVLGLDLLAADGAAVSSTRIREHLTAGEVEEAAQLLGRLHEVRGVVVAGDARGRSLLGYPTANVEVPEEILVPRDGIYAGYFESPDVGTHAAAIYVGRRPTFHRPEAPAILEAFLLDFEGDLYGGAARVRFVSRIRDDRRFESAEALAEQMDNDVAATRAALAG